MGAGVVETLQEILKMKTVEHFDRELTSIDMELARLSQLCQVSLLEPGVAEAVIRGDMMLCSSPNPIAFEKMRGLLILHYHVVNREAANDGVEAAAESVRRALQDVRRRMGLDGGES